MNWQKGLFGVGLILAMLAVGWAVRPLRGKSAAMPLTQELTAEQAAAQELALADERVRALTVDHRTEVFGVRQLTTCADCFQVEIYDWDRDTAVIALVNLHSQMVTAVYQQPGVHPGINKRLADLALAIALNAPEVQTALGYRPISADMAPVDASLVNSACEAGHLCVSPTFDLGDRALWAVVDLTTEELAGLNWTLLAEETAAAGATAVDTGGCPPAGSVNRDGWQLDYDVTGTDGLRATNAHYNGQLVITSAKLLEWHVDYGTTGFEDVTGCGGGGGGFPIFPYGDTQVRDLLDEKANVVGFEVVQDFRMLQWGQNCNYRYEQHYQFWADGRFRLASAAYGRGCGTHALYRPIVRLDLAAGGDDGGDNFAYWDGHQWVAQTAETYRVPYAEAGHGPHQLTAANTAWRITDTTGAGYLLEPAIGQFADGGRGDEPLVYVTLYKPEEGDVDMGVIGDCCADTHEHGPEKFIYGTTSVPQMPEPITHTNLVLWYVPQMATDGDPGSYYCWTVTGEPNPETYPCFGGPLFHPIPAEPVADFAVQEPVVAGQTAVFYNNSTGLNPITYTWSLGDGVTTTVPVPTHVYTAAGEVVVGLTAVNPQGSSTITQTITVQPPWQSTYIPLLKKPDGE
ncbi:MAG: PKD domain-containing protein [Ardenticatenaceae bacterium]|nr:PKD domain-containing protein [Ardenticatenaceae bacterium]